MMRFDARHIGSGVWGIWDGGVMSWKAADLSENEAKRQAADLNVVFNQYGQRDTEDRREVSPPICVESATWTAGELDYWVRDRYEWWGRVRGPDGHHMTAPLGGGQVAYVSFSAEISASTTEALIATMAQLASQGVPEVYLMISTPGGAVMNGLNLYNVLRAMPFKLTTHNVGNVDSIGNAVFLAGETRYACPHSTFMFHGVGFEAPGIRFEEKFLRERLDGIIADQKRIGSILEERSKLSKDDISALFLEATTKDAPYAASVGIIDEVRDVSIPPGSPIISLVFAR